MAHVVYPFEEILQFEGSNSQPPQRVLACCRCHSQKLRCVRSKGNTVCDRCLSADAECNARRPQRLGRPSESQVSSRDASARGLNRISAPGGRASGSSGRRHQARTNTLTSRHQARASDGAAIPDVLGLVDPSAPTPVAPALALTAPAATGALLPSPPSLSAPGVWAWHSADTSGPADLDAPEDSEISDVHRITEIPSNYRGPLTPMGRLSSLLPNFDDVTTLENLDPNLPRTIEPGSAGADDNMAGGQELVSRLAQLHLDLHLCLGSVQLLESAKRTMILSGGGRSGPTAPSGHLLTAESVQQAAKAAETFLDLLHLIIRSELGTRAPLSHHSSVRNGASPVSLNLPPSPNISEPLCMSKRLMITSCYTKLLQIFEVLTSLLLLSQASGGCSLSAVSLKIGRFNAAANKELAVGLVTQYMTHLLDAISAAVENTSCMLGLDHIAKETKKVETRLRAQILTAR